MRRVWVLLAACFLLTAASVEQILVSAQVDKAELRMDEKLVYSITISGSIRETPRIQLSAIQGFRILSSGQSQEVRIQGSQATRALVLTYALAPTAAGSYRLGPVKVEIGGKNYETQPIEVKVLEEDEEDLPEIPKTEGGVIL